MKIEVCNIEETKDYILRVKHVKIWEDGKKYPTIYIDCDIFNGYIHDFFPGYDHLFNISKEAASACIVFLSIVNLGMHTHYYEEVGELMLHGFLTFKSNEFIEYYADALYLVCNKIRRQKS